VRPFLRTQLSLLLIILAASLGMVAIALTPREEEPQIVVPLADMLRPGPGRQRRKKWKSWWRRRWSASCGRSTGWSTFTPCQPARSGRGDGALLSWARTGKPPWSNCTTRYLMNQDQVAAPGPRLGHQAGGDRRCLHRQPDAALGRYDDHQLRRMAEKNSWPVWPRWKTSPDQYRGRPTTGGAGGTGPQAHGRFRGDCPEVRQALMGADASTQGGPLPPGQPAL
jgi:hypothetical protein